MKMDFQEIDRLDLKGKLLRWLGKTDEALNCFKKIFERTETLDSIIQIMICYEDMSNFHEALAWCNKALEKSYNYNLLGIKSKYLFKLGKDDEGISLAEESMKIRGDICKKLNSQGASLGEQGKLEEALKLFNLVLEKDPENYAALENKVKALYSLERYLEVISVIDKFIIDVDSCNPEMLALKGIALFELGKFLDADLWLYKYLTLNPKDVEIIWYKSSTLLKLKKYNEAKSEIEKGLSIEPDNKDLLELKFEIEEIKK